MLSGLLLYVCSCGGGGDATVLYVYVHMLQVQFAYMVIVSMIISPEMYRCRMECIAWGVGRCSTDNGRLSS